jgi:hypothetical protein
MDRPYDYFTPTHSRSHENLTALSFRMSEIMAVVAKLGRFGEEQGDVLSEKLWV